MFLCYGSEEFFDCVNDETSSKGSLNFADMLEERQQKLSRSEARQEHQLLSSAKKTSKNDGDLGRIMLNQVKDKQVEKRDELLDDRLDEADESIFELRQTHIRESRIDDVAGYETTLTPDAVIAQREARRQLRAKKQGPVEKQSQN